GGSTSIDAGRGAVLNATALGIPGSPTVVLAGATPELSGGGAMSGPLVPGGKRRDLRRTNKFTGGVNMNDGNTIVLIETNTALTLSNALSGIGGLTKNGPGVLTVAGTNANTYAAGTIVNEGVLLLNKAPGTNALPGAVTIGDGVGGASADVVRLLADDQI